MGSAYVKAYLKLVWNAACYPSLLLPQPHQRSQQGQQQQGIKTGASQVLLPLHWELKCMRRLNKYKIIGVANAMQFEQTMCEKWNSFTSKSGVSITSAAK